MNEYDSSRIFDQVSLIGFSKTYNKINADLDEEYWQRTKDKAQLIYIDGIGNRAKIEL